MDLLVKLFYSLFTLCSSGDGTRVRQFDLPSLDVPEDQRAEQQAELDSSLLTFTAKTWIIFRFFSAARCVLPRRVGGTAPNRQHEVLGLEVRIGNWIPPHHNSFINLSTVIPSLLPINHFPEMCHPFNLLFLLIAQKFRNIYFQFWLFKKQK